MTAAPLRVCLVSSVPPPYGGIGHWTLLVRRHADARKDLRLQIVNTSPRWRSIDDLTVWKRLVGGGLQLVRDYAKFVRCILLGQDVVHLTTSGKFAIARDLVILTTARLFGIRTIYHLHFGRVPGIARVNAVEWRFLSRAIRVAYATVAMDAPTVSAIQCRLPGVRVLQIPNGVDMAALPARLPPTEPRTVLYLGHVIPTKGIAELVEAWACVHAFGWRCLIVGAGAESYRRALLVTHRPADLEFRREVSHLNAIRLLAAAEVLVLPSHTEGFPNVILEAMALGKGIVATAVGAIPEMLAGDCGIVVPAGDVEALSIALRRILADADMRSAMGIRAQQKARAEYDMVEVFNRLREVWQTAVEERT